MEFFFLPNPYILIIKKQGTGSSTKISNSLSVLRFNNIILTSWINLKLLGTLYGVAVK